MICEKEDAVEDEDEPSSSSLAEAREMTSSSVGWVAGMAWTELTDVMWTEGRLEPT